MKNIYLIFFLLLASSLCAQDDINSCVLCHQDKQDEFSGSVHDSAGFSCHHCHGGDPKEFDPEASMSKDAGFIAIPDKKQTALICGECHSNVEVMNFWALPTDQLAKYRTSAHGRQVLEKGDQNAASCSDCHGYHNITHVKDPQNPVYPTNLPHTCNKCHGDQKLMEKYDLPSNIFDQYQKSVHGIALFEKGDTGVATCASCHGSHGAMPPGVKDVSSTCGKCHINEKKYFSESPHAKLVADNGFSECDSCHGHHTVEPAELELYHTACIKCHQEDSKQYLYGQSIRDILEKNQKFLAEAEKTVKDAAREGMFVEEEEASLEEIKTQVVVSEPEQHTLSKEKILKHQEIIVDRAEKIIDSVDKKKQFIKWRKQALIPIWIFIIVMMVAFGKAIVRLKSKKEYDADLGRRDFLSLVLKGGISALLLGFIAPALAYIWPVIRRGPLKDRVKVCNVDELPVWGVKKVVISGSAVLVIRTPKGFKALSAICTHLGCIVNWNGQKKEIECPCHAGFFDVDGKVISGPPPKALPSYTVQVVGDEVFVKI